MIINPQSWFGQRELNYCPKHFVKANAKLTDESRLWIFEKLSGRFFITNSSVVASIFDFDEIIYFEDPQEAMFYDIAWS